MAPHQGHHQQSETPTLLWPKPEKILVHHDPLPGGHGAHGGSERLEWPPEYIAAVNRVFNGLTNQRAKAAFYALYRPIVGHHAELEGLLYNAPPHWNDRTMTATELDGTVIETYTGS